MVIATPGDPAQLRVVDRLERANEFKVQLESLLGSLHGFRPCSERDAGCGRGSWLVARREPCELALAPGAVHSRLGDTRRTTGTTGVVIAAPGDPAQLRVVDRLERANEFEVQLESLRGSLHGFRPCGEESRDWTRRWSEWIVRRPKSMTQPLQLVLPEAPGGEAMPPRTCVSFRSSRACSDRRVSMFKWSRWMLRFMGWPF
jgi:hypothetical protein